MVQEPISDQLYVEKNQVKSIFIHVSEIYLNTLEHIMKNQNDMFYIYEISPTHARWYQMKDNLIIKNRKAKLEKLNNYEQS